MLAGSENKCRLLVDAKEAIRGQRRGLQLKIDIRTSMVLWQIRNAAWCLQFDRLKVTANRHHRYLTHTSAGLMLRHHK